MDKVLKRRLIGASILIALAVIFVPMLLVDPDAVRSDSGNTVDVPAMPDSAREVRRIPLDPESARVERPEQRSPRREDERRASSEAAGDDRAAAPQRVAPDDEIVLRPDLVRPGQGEDERDPVGGAEDDEESDAGQDASSSRQPPAEESVTPEPEPEPRSEPATADREVAMGDWVVQVASFGSPDSASQVRARLEALGHIVARDEIVRGQSLLYRLRTGPYPSREAAQQALEQITATVAGVEPVVRQVNEELREGEQAGFAVQVGSFVSEDNAESETRRLEGLGFDSFRFSEQVGERLIWRVMVGPVSERGAADELKSRLGSEAGVEGLVVSHP